MVALLLLPALAAAAQQIGTRVKAGVQYGTALAEQRGEPVEFTEPPKNVFERLPWMLEQWGRVKPYAEEAARIAGGPQELVEIWKAERVYAMEREAADRTYEALQAFYGYEEPDDPDIAAQLALPMVGAGAADYRALAEFYGYEEPAQPAGISPVVLAAVALGVWWYLKKR